MIVPASYGFSMRCSPTAKLHSHSITLTSHLILSIRHEQIFLLASKFLKIKRKLRKCIRSHLPGEIKLQERAICMAVFCLSPVSIQKLIPAFRSVSIVSGTPSWKIILENRQLKSQHLKAKSGHFYYN